MDGVRPFEESERFLQHILGEREKIIAYLQSIVRQRDLAEDLFQDVCLLAVKKQDEIADVVHLAGWLRIAARQLALNAIRKRSHRDVLLGEKVFDLMETHWRGIDNVSGAAMGDALESCLRLISPSERELLTARYSDDLKSGELARRLGRPARSIYTTLSRIHRKLAQCILQRIARSTEER